MARVTKLTTKAVNSYRKRLETYRSMIVTGNSIKADPVVFIKKASILIEKLAESGLDEIADHEGKLLSQAICAK